MKPVPLLLTASLVANAGLLAFILLSPRGQNPPRSASSTSTPPAAAAGMSDAGSPASSPAVTASSDVLVAALKSGSHATVRDQLRALGFPEATVQNVIRTLIWQPYFDRQLAINAAKTSSDQPYWRGLQQTGRRAYTREERAGLRQLASTLREQILGVLGPQGFDATSPHSQRYAFLPPESVAKMMDLERDYAEMRQEINQESDRFKVPSDANKLKFLEQERRKDIESTLGPDELADYNLRFSPAAYTLRSRLSKIDLTEAEYRDLYDLQQAYYNQQPDTALARPPAGQKYTPEQIAQLQARVKNYDTLNQEIRQTLGDERYALYQRASDNDYRQLLAAADRFELPAQTVDRVYGYRDATAAASQRISADTSLTPAQKKQAMTALAAQTRQQITTDLGDEISAAYLEKNMKWLDNVQAGKVFTISPDTNRASFRQIASPPRPTAPKSTPVEAR